MKKLLYITLVCVALSSCHHQSSQQTQPPMDVMVITMAQSSSTYAHSYVGRTEDEAVVMMSFNTAGTIQHVYVHNGDMVHAGDSLLRLDDTKTRSLLSVAQAKLQQAEDGYQRVKTVYDEGGITEVKMMEITTQLTEARELVAGLEAQLRECTLLAPVEATVSALNAHVGQNVLPDMPVLNLHNRACKNIVFTVPEQDIVHVQTGDRVVVNIPALGQRTWQAVVYERSLTPNTLAHSYEVRCHLIGDGSSILPGMGCKVHMSKEQVSGFMVPAECVQMFENQLYLWINRDGCAQRVPVYPASFTRDGVLITQGLEQGDQVIVSGYQKLYNGAAVTAHEKE